MNLNEKGRSFVLWCSGRNPPLLDAGAPPDSCTGAPSQARSSQRSVLRYAGRGQIHKACLSEFPLPPSALHHAVLGISHAVAFARSLLTELADRVSAPWGGWLVLTSMVCRMLGAPEFSLECPSSLTLTA